MRKDRLLERMRNLKQTSHTTKEHVCLGESISRYLSLIFNTQQGTALTVPEFGMPDFNQGCFGAELDEIRGLEKVIVNLILRYEPRVQQVAVDFLPQDEDPLSLVFRIATKVGSGSTPEPLVFETVLGPDGRISVSQSRQSQRD